MMRFHDLIGRNEIFIVINVEHYFTKNSSELIYIFHIFMISYIYVFYVLTDFLKIIINI